MGGDSGKWFTWEGGISRNSFCQIDGDKQRAPDWEDPKFRLANITGESAGGPKSGAFNQRQKASNQITLI